MKLSLLSKPIQVLTKQYPALTQFTYPENLWLGISVTKQQETKGILYLLYTDAKIKFISFEPLLEEIDINLTGIDWIIIARALLRPQREIKDKKVGIVALTFD